MNNEIYKQYKAQIKHFADILPNGDKPARMMALNDFLDSIDKDQLSYDLLRERITQKQYDLYHSWLELYVCKRHIK